MFDRVHKDWFDVCLCLWIVKTIVLPESGHDPLARRSFSILRIFLVCCISRCEIFQCRLVTFCFLWDVSEEVRGRIFSSFNDPVLPTAMQWQCPKQDEAYCSKSGEEYKWCVHSFRSAASWWLYQFPSAWLAVWLRCCLRSRKHLPLFPLSSTCRNRTLGLCSNLPWKCFWLLFPLLLRIDSSPLSRLPGVFIWLGSLECPVGPLWKGLGLSQIVILWATDQLLSDQLLLAKVFHA